MKRLLALIVLLSCGCVNPKPCTQDSQCGSGAYCDFPVLACPGVSTESSSGDAPIGTLPAKGTCHRNCSDGLCLCNADDDCGGLACNTSSHVCVPLGCPASFCPDECPGTKVESQACGSCICASCPDVDAGQCLTWDAGYYNRALSPQTCTCADSTTAQYGCNGPPACEDACCGHGGAAPDAG